MRKIARLATVGVATALTLGVLSSSPASASCLEYEQHPDPFIEGPGTTAVYYPPLVSDIDPQDCLRAEQDVPRTVEL